MRSGSILHLGACGVTACWGQGCGSMAMADVTAKDQPPWEQQQQPALPGHGMEPVWSGTSSILHAAEPALGHECSGATGSLQGQSKRLFFLLSVYPLSRKASDGPGKARATDKGCSWHWPQLWHVVGV